MFLAGSQVERRWNPRIEERPMPVVTACLHFEVEDCDPMRTASAHSFSRIVDYETMHMVSSYLCRASPIGADNLAWLGDRREGPT